jgi:glycosyltransferase involved in cell wall biosynthesis
MKKRIRILRIIHSLNPIYGGPQNAIIDNSLSLIQNGIEVDILTSDNENYQLKKKNNIKIFNKGPSLNEYGLNFKLFYWLFKNKKNYDFFIIHGIWSFYTLIARIILKKRFFVFTHGQLDPFFSLNFLKKIKKKLYWFLIEKNNLIASRSLFLTSDLEKKLITRTYVNTSGLKKIVVNYGISKPTFNKKQALKVFNKRFPTLKSKNFLLFLGRFHEKKGCEILIQALKKLKEKKVIINIMFAGPNNKYKDDLKNIAKSFELDKQIIWSDIISNELKWGAITASKGMVLSSHGENFGVSLIESLSCGKPVLTTYKVNIYPTILKKKCGFISKNNINDFSKILLKFNDLNIANYQILSNNSIKCFNDNFSLDKKNDYFSNFLKKQINLIY